MKIGIVVSTNDPETCWNALRFANHCRGKGEETQVFFMGKGVEYLSGASGAFNTGEQAEKFLGSGGRIQACGTCLKSRGQDGGALCPVSTMQDLYTLVRDSDRVVSF